MILRAAREVLTLNLAGVAMLITQMLSRDLDDLSLPVKRANRTH